MEIDIQGVKITLTQDQLNEIAKQTQKYNIEDIDYPLACKILNEEEFKAKDFKRPSHWITEQLEMIIKAVNFLDNNKKIWTPDFNNRDQTKYRNWFEKTASGWSFGHVSGSCYYSVVSGGLYFMKSESAKIIAKKRIDLYSQYLG